MSAFGIAVAITMHEELFDLCHIQHTGIRSVLSEVPHVGVPFAPIGLPETDDPTPTIAIVRPVLAAGEVRQQALIAWAEGGMVASPN